MKYFVACLLVLMMCAPALGGESVTGTNLIWKGDSSSDYLIWDDGMPEWGTIQLTETTNYMDTITLDGKDGRIYTFEIRIKFGRLKDDGTRVVEKGDVPEIELVFIGMEKK